MIYQSSRLLQFGFLHGFTSHWVNLGNNREKWDFHLALSSEKQMLSREILSAELRRRPLGLCEVLQVHGEHIVDASLLEERDAHNTLEQKADALIARPREQAFSPLLGIRTADCVPVLLANLKTGEVGAIHAGWRGVYARIVIKSLEALLLHTPQNQGTSWHAVLGPSIGSCCFDVGSDVAAKIFSAREHSDLVSEMNEKTNFIHLNPDRKVFLDLREEIEIQLANFSKNTGIVITFERLGECTKCTGDTYPSFRREGESSARQLAFIAPKKF